MSHSRLKQSQDTEFKYVYLENTSKQECGNTDFRVIKKNSW